ncbi:NYN domain-containing protein [Sporolituus thermophilus]|uniref:NYN domain-containing protein n=1 Tax=Sporolituus thermophilus DSM 23256 TaxID=1123285 RepID=A0A1G7PI86_9FIRM|nr:NYN domain-containing protein [Sporolituus thermophilus]SDF85804.1 hypothetical protein SAMN05660235_02964 [Sporolituus thermophilus DSM 23256]
MNTTLIVDGYNVINAWPELAALKEDSLEHAREKLLEVMAGYGAYKGYRVIVVFDAHAVAGMDSVEQITPDLEVVYTGEGQTADSYIEKMVYYLVRQGHRVYVVTSDWAEQMVILGAGAFRIPARELWQDVREMKRDVADKYGETVLTYRRHELGSRLNHEVVRRLNELRRGR